MTTFTKGLLAATISAILISGCQTIDSRHGLNHIPQPAAAATQPVNYPGLHNLVSYTDKIVCGAVPEGAEGFELIKAMGITTVISVDGAKPDVELAHKEGLKYIHLPIGYNGMTPQRTLEIARAIQLADGPVYLHCHHGKHRSAGAAGAAAVTLGLMTRDEALAKMKISGTAPAYKGLFEAVKVAAPAGDQLNSVAADFPESCEISDFVDNMVSIDETLDLIKAVEKAGWKSAEIKPAEEAGKLSDLLRIAHDIPAKNEHPEDFFNHLTQTSQLATNLEEGLLSGDLPPTELSKRLNLIGQSCKDCHTSYRDPVVPQ